MLILVITSLLKYCERMCFSYWVGKLL